MTHYALLSVSDKTGIIDIARILINYGYSLLSTGGTYHLLNKAGIQAIDVSDYTGTPEMLDGRVKTLHPKIHGGLLAQIQNDDHLSIMATHQIEPIDIAIINLYPFIQTISKEQATFNEAIENIDIGGPALIRASAKNHSRVTIIVDPQDYKDLSKELDTWQGQTSHDFRFRMAKKAFSHTAAYDGAISNYLTSLGPNNQRTPFPETLNIQIELEQTLRYGENPHQIAAYYRDKQTLKWRQIQGKPLSFNNISDADTAWKSASHFSEAACIIVKHATPCGAAYSTSLAKAYQKAYSCDPSSAFGGIIAFNQELDQKTAQLVSNQFAEIIIAPGYSPEALSILALKNSLRLIQPEKTQLQEGMDMRRLNLGWLIQTYDNKMSTMADLSVVTQLAPAENQMLDLLFAWNIVQEVKSNAIVIAHDHQTIGIGGGQVSRVDSVQVAISKARQNGFSLSGAVLASDAFF
ncbi:MAG: bifunctional phosphoribosylaminoimidazolecarboxamide formyltransferase/IMP cyclohydrolase, partial [Pseudomonadota bacterium]|nr:bifunctional phosphoribosylaminoimidazolecarboxamide formyltransferase/IMP cyclohydrolase [Pseudomonadota bacterium]